MTIAEAIAKALEGLGKGAAATAVLEPAVGEIASEMGKYLKAKGTENAEDYFNGDDVHDRAVMKGAALANEIQSSTDWSAVPGSVLRTAFTVVKTAGMLAAIFG